MINGKSRCLSCINHRHDLCKGCACPCTKRQRLRGLPPLPCTWESRLGSPLAANRSASSAAGTRSSSRAVSSVFAISSTRVAASAGTLSASPCTSLLRSPNRRPSGSCQSSCGAPVNSPSFSRTGLMSVVLAISRLATTSHQAMKRVVGSMSASARQYHWQARVSRRRCSGSRP